MVLSNHDSPLRIEIGDRRIVCFDVSSRCKGNTVYFKRLAKVLEHPDTPNVVMSYLLSLDISDWSPDQLPNCVHEHYIRPPPQSAFPFPICTCTTLSLGTKGKRKIKKFSLQGK